jgi:hypothetical protein
MTGAMTRKSTIEALGGPGGRRDPELQWKSKEVDEAEGHKGRYVGLGARAEVKKEAMRSAPFFVFAWVASPTPSSTRTQPRCEAVADAMGNAG